MDKGKKREEVSEIYDNVRLLITYLAMEKNALSN